MTVDAPIQAAASAPASNNSYVPTIDITPYLEDPTSPAALKVVAAVRQACTTIGFFALTGHGIPRSLQDEVFAGTKKLFALPKEEKLKLERKYQAPLMNRGYEVMGTQVLQEGAAPDQKEVTTSNHFSNRNRTDKQRKGFYVSQSFPSTNPRCAEYPAFVGPNVFPDPALLPDTSFRTPVETYYAAMRSLASTILKVLAAGLPYGPQLFDDFCTEPLAVLRLLHYPPADAVTLGAGAHTDFGAITLLLQDEHKGLQVLHPETEEWMPIDPNPDA